MESGIFSLQNRVSQSRMNPDKRHTIEAFLLGYHKKARRDPEAEESNTIVSSSTPIAESEHHAGNVSISGLADQTMSDLVSDTSSSSLANCASLNESFEAKTIPHDISASGRDLPAQPKLKSYPANQQQRSFRSSWYADRQWLEYSIQNDACYCFYCRHFSSNKLNANDAFCTTGFNNWKKALDKYGGLIKHASSQCHTIATANYLSQKQREATSSNVLQQLDSSRTAQIRKNRERLGKICSTLLFLARQMIGLRGHDETERYV